MGCPVAESLFFALQQVESIPPWRKFRAPPGFQLVSPRLCAQAELADRIRAHEWDAAGAERSRRLLLVLIDLIHSGECLQPACCSDAGAGDVDADDHVSCEPLYELLGELTAAVEPGAAEGKPSAASSYQRFTMQPCFPLCGASSSAAFCTKGSPSAAGIPITVRSSPTFSDISQRIWPATFTLVDALLLLAPAIGACARPQARAGAGEADGAALAGSSMPDATSTPTPTSTRPWSCIEMGSGTGLAGIALAHAFATTTGGRGAASGGFVSACRCMKMCNVTLTDGCAASGVPLLQSNALLSCNSMHSRVEKKAEGVSSGCTAADATSAPRALRSPDPVPVCVHHWRWGDDGEGDAEAEAAAPEATRSGRCSPSILSSEAASSAGRAAAAHLRLDEPLARAFLCGSDLVYDPDISAQLVKTLRAQLRPRTAGSAATEARSWREHMALVLAADDSNGGASRPVPAAFPWHACSPNCSGSGSGSGSGSAPVFALLCSTMRNRETYGCFVEGVLRAGLVYYDLTHEVEELRKRSRSKSRGRGTAVADSCGGAGVAADSEPAPASEAKMPQAEAAQSSRICEATLRNHVETAGVAPPLVPSASHTALLRFSNIWEALLRPKPDAEAEAQAPVAGVGSSAGAPSGDSVMCSMQVASVQLPAVVGLVLPPLLC